MREPGAEPTRTRRRVRGALLVAIGALYAISIPWYRETGAAPDTWLGLPEWVTVAVVCYAAVAVLNSLAWLLAEVSDAPGDDRGGGGP
jgi:hypothetical protein